MTLQELKSKIESKSFDSRPVIFQTKDSKFIPNQYIQEIAKSTYLDTVYIDSIDYSPNLFGIEEDCIQVHICDTFVIQPQLLKKKYLYVICKTVENKDGYEDIIVTIPKLEKWHLLDYAYSICDGVDKDLLAELVNNCNYEINRLDNELSKISIFDKSKQQFVFNMMLEDNAFIDISKYKIFDFSNAIIKKDIKTLIEVFEKISSIDIEPIGLLTILVNQFRNIISIQLANNPTPESTGLKPNQFWAIRHSCGLYTKEQLVNIYMFLTDIDRKIKIGDMPMNSLIDYLVIKVMSF